MTGDHIVKRCSSGARRAVSTTLAAALVAVLLPLHRPAPARAAEPGSLASESFSFTGSPQTYAVPAGVGSIAGEVVGAAGGAGGVGKRSVGVATITPLVTVAGPFYGEPTNGGIGGSTDATLAVTPGQELTIQVGGAGADGSTGNETTAATGGYGGGAPSGTTASPKSDGGGGGGASAILSGGTPLLVAGGGGGGGGTFLGNCAVGSSEAIGNGGNGGENGPPGDGESGASAGESEEARPTVVTVSPLAAFGGPPTPTNGEGGFGGSSQHPGGEHGQGLAGTSDDINGGSGGGGGGGYYGGSGGAFGACRGPGAITGGGGGGGSDYAFSGATAVVYQRAVLATEPGDGTVTLSYYVPFPTMTQAAPSPASAKAGESITLTAKVSAAGSCDGSVQFTIDGKDVGAPVTVHGNTADTGLEAPAAGNHPITASYSGALSTASGPGCLPSSSAPAALSVAYPTTTQAAPSPASASSGETITLTATVTASVQCPGTVQFEIDGEPVGGPITLQQGKAQTTTTAPAAGNHPIIAVYSGAPAGGGEPGCLPSSSAPSTLSVSYPTATHASPSPAAANVGETVTITATVTAPPGVSCPGTVQFEIDGKPIGNPVAVQNGAAQTTTTAPPAGEHPILASYSGTPSTATQAGCLPSISAPTTLTTKSPALSQAEALVSPRACQSARHFTIHLQLPRQQKLLVAHIYVGHKLAKTLTGGTRSYHLNLRGRPYSTVIVTLTATEAGGRHVTGERIYHTCRAHKLPGHRKFNI
jgi:hypothetical protein